MTVSDWLTLSNNDKKTHWRIGFDAYVLLFPERLAFARRIECNPSIYNIKLLAKEIASKQLPQQEQTRAAVLPSEVVQENLPEEEQELPTVELTQEASTRLDELIKKQQHLFNQKAKLSNTLFDYAEHDNAGRALVVTEIERLRVEYNRLAVLKKFVQKQGYFPEPIEEQDEATQARESIAELRLALKNAHTNKSKKAKNLRNAQAKGNKALIKKYEEGLAQIQNVISDINNRISLLNGK